MGDWEPIDEWYLEALVSGAWYVLRVQAIDARYPGLESPIAVCRFQN